jgi:two-component system NarL family sensor kinase
MRHTERTHTVDVATAETERIVGWLRFPAIGLLAVGQGISRPDPTGVDSGFFVALGVFTVWSVVAFLLAERRLIGPRFPLFATGVDIAMITALAWLSGGAFSSARLAYFLVPVAVAFRFRPRLTALAAATTIAAYVLQAVAHPARKAPDAFLFVFTQAGYLAWVGAACVLLSALLGSRIDGVASLAAQRTQLLADALTAEQRERRALAEGLHDDAIQNLLSARQDIDEAAASGGRAFLDRAGLLVSETIGDLREAVFDLHPYVLDATGLTAALHAAAERAAERGGFVLELDIQGPGTVVNDQLLYSAARELLSNVVRHAHATHVAVGLGAEGDDLVLRVADDGRGFDPAALAERLEKGHIGVASQRVRIEAAGGSLRIVARPLAGTVAEVRLPANRLDDGQLDHPIE